MRRAGIAIVVLVIVILAYVAWIYARPTTHILPGARDVSGAFKHSEPGEYYTIDAAFPDHTPLYSHFEPGADLRARNTIETFLTNDIADFKQNSGVDSMSPEEQAFLHQNGAKYVYGATYKQYKSSNGNLLSYEFDVYVDTGGAHPNRYFKTFVFDKDGNDLTLADFFTPGSNYLDQLSTAATTQITAQLTDRLGADATSTIFADGLAPTENNFSNFVIDGTNLVILIPPYQVAAYAAGTFQVSVPLSQLASIVRSEWR